MHEKFARFFGLLYDLRLSNSIPSLEGQIKFLTDNRLSDEANNKHRTSTTFVGEHPEQQTADHNATEVQGGDETWDMFEIAYQIPLRRSEEH